MSAAQEALSEYLDVPRWVAWAWKQRGDGKPTKVPLTAPNTYADSTDPNTWVTYEQAQAVGADGIGFILAGDGLGGIDLDDCRDPETGDIDDWAREIIDMFRSYAEVSPSGTGVKILAAGAPSRLPGSKYKPEGARGHADVFVSVRFFTITGELLEGCPDEIRDCGELGGAWDLLAEKMGEYRGRVEEREDVQVPEAAELTDDLLERMSQHPLTWARWTKPKDSSDRSVSDAALTSAMARDGFDDQDIAAALSEYPHGQIGSGKLNGNGADRQLGRLLGIAHNNRPEEPTPHPDEDELTVDAESVANAFLRHDAEKRRLQAEEDARIKATPIASLEEMSVSSMMEEEPPLREWLLQDVLPLGVVGGIGAAGGVGKSTATLQLSCCIAAGLPFRGMTASDSGGVLILSAEDDRDEIHRRLHRVRSWIEDTHQWHAESAVEAIQERLFVADRVGQDNLLTHVVDRSIVRTHMAERIAATAHTVPEVKLIVVDPLARFRGGGANGEEEATRFVEAMEVIRKETGATVLAPAHLNKMAMRSGSGTQDAFRGSSGLVDGMRWAATMMTMSEENAEARGIDTNDAARWVHFAVPKNNYAPPLDPIWLYRQDNGILVPDAPAGVKEKPSKANKEYVRVLRAVRKHIKDHGPMSARQLRERAGMHSQFRVGEKAMRDIINRAVAEGNVEEQPAPDGSNHTLIVSVIGV